MGAAAADSDGREGRDRVMYVGRGDAVTLTLGNDVAPGTLTGDDGVEGENDALRAIEDATTGSGDDLVTGSAASNSLATGGGNDTVTAAGGNDSVMSGGGNDTVDAGDGDDGIVAGDGDDSVTGGEGADSLEGGDGADSLNAGGGIDGLNGGAGADALIGGDGDDALDGGGGADQLVAGPGDDVLTDGDGAHADGPDLLDGGDGHDLVSYALRLAGVTVDLAVGGAVFGEAGERDTVVSAESATGGRGGDTLLGSGAGNELIGGGGDDTLDGRDGGDALSGDAGDDSLTGGSGADSLGGGAGADLFATSDGTADRASCGIGPDTVNGDPNDVVDPDCETVNGTKLVVRAAKCKKVKLNRKLRRNRNKIRATCTLDPAPARGTTATLSRGSKRVAKGKVALGGKLTLTGKGKKWPGGKKTLILRINRQNVPYTNNL
jgi:Ca2+-binding RTX toxin-like protein